MYKLYIVFCQISVCVFFSLTSFVQILELSAVDSGFFGSRRSHAFD